MRKLFVLTGLFYALLTGAAPGRLAAADLPLVDRVIDTIQRYERMTIFDDVKIEVDDKSTVRLTGRVTTPLKRDEIGERVEKVSGVASLVNDIHVLPLSPFDAQLRQRVATAIYSYPPFWHYASMAVPPIHILVERGYVTLTGRVRSQQDRDLAYARAQVPGALGVTSELKVDGER
jgi:hyperosmotically inducible protein